MAKLKAPLFSLGASGALGKSIVYFGWKGLDVVREYVIPTNPKSAGQLTQRGYMTACVTAIHAAQALAVSELDARTIIAYALLASVVQSATTWFNQITRDWLNQRVAGLRSAIFRASLMTPGNGNILADLYFTEDGANTITAGDWWYGTSKSALVNKMAATVTTGHVTDTITGLTNGVKYYVQFRPTAHADFVGLRGPIDYATPSA